MSSLWLCAYGGGSPIVFSLLDSAGGAFTIDPVSGVVRLAAGLDFETSKVRTIVARLDVGQPPDRRLYERAYPISIPDSPASALRVDFPFTHARFGDAAISVAGVISHPELAGVRVSASAGGAVVQAQIVDGTFQVRDVPISGDGTFTLTVADTIWSGDLAYDGASHSVIIVRENPACVERIDGTGAIASIDAPTPACGPTLTRPIGVAVDSTRQIGYVTDDFYDAVIAVDLRTGCRQLIAK